MNTAPSNTVDAVAESLIGHWVLAHTGYALWRDVWRAAMALETYTRAVFGHDSAEHDAARLLYLVAQQHTVDQIPEK